MRFDAQELYRRLHAAYGPQGWWPISHAERGIPGYDPRFEVMVGAILTQMVAWTNVEKALTALATEGVLSLAGLRGIEARELERHVRPAGFFREKAKKLKALVEFMDSRFEGELDALASLPAKRLREELLSVRGVGEETADSMVLYAFGKPSFVVDAYTRRLCALFGVGFGSYGEYQSLFESSLPRSPKLWNEYHALIVRWGKDWGTGNKKTSSEARRVAIGRH